MILFLALGVISYFQIGQIDENIDEIIQSRALGKRAVGLHQRYKELDSELEKAKDARNRLFVELTDTLQSVEEIFNKSTESTAGTELRRSEKSDFLPETLAIQRAVTDLIRSLGVYLQMPGKEHEKKVLSDVNDVQWALAGLHNLSLTEQQHSNLAKGQNRLKRATNLVRKIIALGGQSTGKAKEFEKIKDQLDGLLGGDFEVFTRADLERAQDAGRKMVNMKLLVTLILIFTGTLDVCVFNAAIKRSITRPLINLKNAITEIGRGEFDAQIEVSSADEIGQLATAFKKMARQRGQTEDELRKARDKLEVRVAQRTTELVQANQILEGEIRERKKAEVALEELNRDLEASVSELVRSNTELQEFSYIAAHDLKTPLRGIAILADWISMDYTDKLDEKAREHMDLLLARARKLDAMVDSILQYSSIRQIDRKKRRVDINVVVSQVIAGIEAPENVRINTKNKLPVLICDEEQIKNVFLNLIHNAIKHGASSDRKIEIGCTEKKDFWIFTISDNGPGIDPKYFKKIFRIFQALSPAERTEGTGIGLSVVKKTIELNGGSVWVDSEIGKGSTFYFTLPTNMNAPITKTARATDTCC